MRTRAFFFSGLIALAVSGGACAGSPPAQAVLGAYLADDGEVTKVTFSDATHYAMVYATCADGPICIDHGIYKLSPSYDTITFTNQNGVATSVPFQATATGAKVSAASTTKTQGVDLGGAPVSLLADGGTCLADGEFVSSFTLSKHTFKGGSPCPVAPPAIISSFSIPSEAGEGPVIDAIEKAHSSIRMIMFHLTNPAVVTALVAAAKRKVDIEIILDQGNLTSHTPTSITAPLAKAKIKVIPSSTAFTITHVKSLVIDNATAIISSLNLTMTFPTTRDFGVVTTDDDVIAEFMSVFNADVINAQKETGTTPKLSDPYLVWSPVNSESRIAALAKSAKKTLIATSENLGDAEIDAALIAAAKRGVNVRVISPLCDQNPNPLFDLPYLAALAKGGVEARAMPAPPTATVPYMHAKLMVADGEKAYVGSVNFSTSSTTKSRELGIIFTDLGTINMLLDTFESDWGHAEVPPAESSVKCPTTG